MCAVCVVPGYARYCVCGISHASTMVTQASTGSKTVDLSQALTNRSPLSPSVLSSLRRRLAPSALLFHFLLFLSALMKDGIWTL